MKNIEDWDFRNCSIDSLDSPDYDLEADLFFGRHFTAAVAVDAMRLEIITTFLDKGLAELEADRQHVRLVASGDAYLYGWKSGASRFTRDGRFERRVVEALRREHRKYGHLRVTILPALPGFQSDLARP